MTHSDLPSSAKRPIEDASTLLDRATDRHRQGALEEAEALYRELLCLEPEHFDALNRLGVLKLQRRELEEACRFLAAAIARKPASDAALSNYATVLLELKRFDQALQTYDLALALKPDEPYLLYNRARVLREMRRYQEALACLDRLLAIAPNDQQGAEDRVAVIRLLLAEAAFAEVIARYKKGDASGGYSLCNRVLSIDPKHFNARWGSVIGTIPSIYTSLEETASAT